MPCRIVDDPATDRIVALRKRFRLSRQKFADRFGLDARALQEWEQGRRVPGAGRTNLAWMVTAGVAAARGERVTVDLAWRYTDLGAVHTGRGAGRVIWRDGSREPLALDLAPTRARLAGHGFQMSLRYSF